jgi:hypothetical protein
VTSPAIEPEALQDPVPPPARGRGRRREALTALAIAATLAVAGAPLGLLWRLLAPKVEFVMTDFGATTVEQEPEGYIAGDGWYVLITLAVGVLAAGAVWAVFRRRRGPLLLLGLVVGCVAGGALTAWVGHQFGYAHYRDLIAHAPVGTHFFRPPSVRSGRVGLWFGFLPRVQGAVLVQALAAATTYLLLAAFHMSPDLRRPVEGDGEVPAAAPGGWEEPGAVSSEPTESTAPSASPAPPGSGPAAPPRG